MGVFDGHVHEGIVAIWVGGRWLSRQLEVMGVVRRVGAETAELFCNETHCRGVQVAGIWI